MVPELQIESLLLVPIIVGLIQAIKAAGMPAKFAPWLNAVFSVAFYAVMIWITAQPQYLHGATIGLNGLMVFLAAAGFYDRAEATLTRR